MSYKVLARKWRPATFASMLGQDTVIKALQNSLENNRLHHAYLFTGTRGVGKTTIARIFAKSLNCELGLNKEPCDKCSNCQAVTNGNFFDMFEVDAASKTGVEDTREMLESIQFVPSVGRYKILLIDEVHMFSKSSFNALLKSLEEPPKHIIFMLATTDPQKLPPTILSRCLQFNLSRLSEQQLADYFCNILKQENISFEPDGVEQIALAADGSVRDGLSLLDQAIAYTSGNVSSDSVATMLGTIEDKHIHDILTHLACNNIDNLLKTIEQLSLHTTDFSRVLDTIALQLHQISISQLTKTDNKFKDLFSAEMVQLMYQIALKSKQDLPLAPTMRIGLEMALMRMIAFQPAKKKL